MEEMQGMTTERDALPMVLMDSTWMLAQRKHVGIHKVHWGNKWMGSLNLGVLNKTNKSNSWLGPQNKAIKTTSKWTQQNNKQMMLGCGELRLYFE